MRVLVTGGAGRIRATDGTLVRVQRPWAPERWDDGYVDAGGRMRVYRPGHHRADERGYVLRAIVVWELSHGRPVVRPEVVHHANGDRLDDRSENLMLLSLAEHTRMHSVSEV